MKPKNFPTRKHQRRVEALERLKQYAGDFPTNNQKGAMKHLEVLNAQPVQTRTKKDRSSRAKLKGF